MLATFCSDLGSGAACEERLFGLIVLAWMPEKISSLKRKKKEFLNRQKKKKEKHKQKKENIYTNHARLKSGNRMGYQKNVAIQPSLFDSGPATD